MSIVLGLLLLWFSIAMILALIIGGSIRLADAVDRRIRARQGVRGLPQSDVYDDAWPIITDEEIRKRFPHLQMDE